MPPIPSKTTKAVPILSSGPSGTVASDKPTFSWAVPTGTFATTAQYNIWVDDRTTGQSDILNAMVTGTTLNFSPTAPSQALTPGHSYRWWVGAVSTDGVTFWSNAQDFAIATLAVPDPSSGPSGTVASERPTFTWTVPTGTFPVAAQYNVWLDDQTAGQIDVLNAKVAGATFAFTPAQGQALTPGHSYRWWVGAVSTNGVTFWSSAQEFGVAPLTVPTPSAPSGDVSSLTPNFTWTAVPSGSFTPTAHYTLWLTDKTTGQSRTQAAGSSLSFPSTSSLTPGHSYRWWVGAVSTNGAIF